MNLLWKKKVCVSPCVCEGGREGGRERGFLLRLNLTVSEWDCCLTLEKKKGSIASFLSHSAFRTDAHVCEGRVAHPQCNPKSSDSLLCPLNPIGLKQLWPN